MVEDKKESFLKRLKIVLAIMSIVFITACFCFIGLLSVGITEGYYTIDINIDLDDDAVQVTENMTSSDTLKCAVSKNNKQRKGDKLDKREN